MALNLVAGWIDSLSAATGAEFFLSPFADARVMCEATKNDGPSLWIVNRSDVFDATLEGLLNHPLESIRARAQDKLTHRRTSLQLLEPPVIDIPVQDIPDFAIEDYLGHPLAPFELILFFMKHLSADVRASACLSLTRRLVEHPPSWTGFEHIRDLIIERAGQRLLDEPSEFVRLYAARIPLQSAATLDEAFGGEDHPMIQSRLLQNPSTSARLCIAALESDRPSFESTVVALTDKRVNPQSSWNSLGFSEPQVAIVKELANFRSQL